MRERTGQVWWVITKDKTVNKRVSSGKRIIFPTCCRENLPSGKCFILNLSCLLTTGNTIFLHRIRALPNLLPRQIFTKGFLPCLPLPSLASLFLSLFFDIGLPADMELLGKPVDLRLTEIHLPLSPECWDSRWAPPCLASLNAPFLISVEYFWSLDCFWNVDYQISINLDFYKLHF